MDSEGTSVVTENTFLIYGNQFSSICYFDLVTGVFGPAHVIMELITWAPKQGNMFSEFFYQVILNLGCSATETSFNIEMRKTTIWL